MKLAGLLLIVLFYIDTRVVSDTINGCSGYRAWLERCYYNNHFRRRCVVTESFQCNPTQSDDKSSWCVEAQGAPINYTFAKTEGFPYDCRGTRECVRGTVREISFRCDATCEKALAEGYKAKYYCYNKCICPRGQYKSRNGNCIWLGDCRRQSCTAPKVYKDCPSKCQPACENLEPNTKKCDSRCREDVCVCPEEMVLLNETSDKCVMPSQCPKHCTAPKVYEQCPSKCQPTCENREPNIEQCDPGCREDVCICPEEMVLLNEASGKCVMPSQCPIRCQFPEVRANCRTTCSVRCDNLETLDVQDCDVECGEEFCACADGYLQKSESNQTCVLVASCLSLIAE